MKQSQESYNSLSKDEKKDILYTMYITEKKSFYDIAQKYNTYANKIRRDAVSLNIPIRNKSEAQKNALQIGNHKHPTKGQKRTDETKQKIGKAVLLNWENMDTNELEKRKEASRKKWESMSQDQKDNMLKLANDAVRLSSKVGSKLEKYLFENLIKDGYKVEFHKEQTLSNTKLQIDIFLPTISTAIEIDGPSHFLPVWGQDALNKNKKYDNKKEGLIIGKGWKLIRIKQTKDFSKTRADIIYDQLILAIDSISKKTDNSTSITIEDNNG